MGNEVVINGNIPSTRALGGRAPESAVGAARDLKVPGIIDGSTRIMGIIGDPIAQVITPRVINPIFEALGANTFCIPIHVAARDLPDVWCGLKKLKNLVGFGVTLPHKQQIFGLCDSLDPAAERVGAVNLVRREANGEFRGYQFDGEGFVRGLVNRGHDLKGRECTIIGAGGAAAAITFRLVDAGIASITIVNRTKEKAETLADDVNLRTGLSIAGAGDPAPNDHQLIINATSLGMRDDDPLPMPLDRINATMLVAEVVANPVITRFLTEAESRGATIHSGEHMVKNQVDLIARHLVGVLN
jgi:shikimate dehydrogenase